ncbi:undecaprenyl diphosphate synthase [Anseongella ginsenosidimutans]|uniref:Isoprenyl transferase n=1 Tax=Anseongella ginsenosidimutans TaxID=496056 RepID=A0A4R3KXE6_9SPHI|nr:isoprenyl transferase [Anseongella ginsenosidimutans]QEC50985.1 isoprenyl transferase [Anseongella ginsenosidimutans]TCS90365.1 undecaprenyl diphosphate synthase [Anseongella ginsenosidimutans]
MSKQDQIDKARLPRHVAIIMDGNGRWAKKKGLRRVLGHQNGVKAVRDTVEAAAELGIKYVTLYAFSTENWKRPQYEVNALMELLVSTIHKEVKTLMKNEIRLGTIGNLGELPKNCYTELMEAIELTRKNTRMTLNLALSYSARWEITQAMKKAAAMAAEGRVQPDDITEEYVSSLLCTADMPDPELMIRTSGEHRISNFLLWQIAYAELYFTEKFWPDFRRDDFYDAIISFQGRERRFGQTSEQIVH